MSQQTVALALDSVALVTADLESAARFYTRALGCVAVGRGPIAPAWHALFGTADRQGEWLTLRLGGQAMELLAFDPPGRPYPSGSTSTDLWFQHIAFVVRDMPAVRAMVLAAGATPISTEGPERLPASAGGVEAFKFRDPEGHPLELLAFPDGAGDPRWHARGPAAPVLGYDHSAIAVSDADATAAFYGAALGLRRGAGSLNRGPGQQRLDDVARDVVDVVPLSPLAPTPHLELLGYRTGSRRSRPVGPADIAATRTIFSAGPLPDDTALDLPEGGRAVALGDPDGHRLILVERPMATRTATP